MVCDRVHLLELGHVDVAESAGFCSRLGNLSSCSIDKRVFLLCFCFFLEAQLLLDSCGVLANAIHQLATFVCHV